MIGKQRNTSFQKAYKFLIQSGKIESQQDIVDKTGVNKGALSQYVNAKQELSKPFKTKFQQVFGVNLADFGENPLTEPPTILSTDSENPKREKMESDLNKLISSNQLLAEANKDLAAGHKLLVEMLYRSTGGAVAKNVEDLNALVIGLQSVLLEVATGKRFANDFEVIKAMHKADGKTPKVEKKGIRDLVDNQDTAL